jgi:hypothetical protein
MNRSFIQLRRALFGASCAIVFGFGAAQALASPAPAAFYGCTEKEEQACNDTCRKLWGPSAVGDCLGYGGGFYQCECGITVEW